MKKLFKNIFRTAGLILPAFVAIFVLASCSDDDDNTPTTTLASPVVTIGEVTSSTINFTWTTVEGARQYSYRVTNPNGKEVKADVTQENSVTASKLQPLHHIYYRGNGIPYSHWFCQYFRCECGSKDLVLRDHRELRHVVC